MPLRRLDHVNIRTAQLGRLIEWYRDVLGLEPGPRPDFPFGGAWLYCDGYPVVHLVETRSRHQGLDPTLEHFAFSAEGLDQFLEHLRAHSVAYRCGTAPGEAFGIKQVNIWDPDGNHIHVDFARTETSALFADYDPP